MLTTLGTLTFFFFFFCLQETIDVSEFNLSWTPAIEAPPVIPALCPVPRARSQDFCVSSVGGETVFRGVLSKPQLFSAPPHVDSTCE